MGIVFMCMLMYRYVCIDTDGEQQKYSKILIMGKNQVKGTQLFVQLWHLVFKFEIIAK